MPHSRGFHECMERTAIFLFTVLINGTHCVGTGNGRCSTHEFLSYSSLVLFASPRFLMRVCLSSFPTPNAVVFGKGINGYTLILVMEAGLQYSSMCHGVS